MVCLLEITVVLQRLSERGGLHCEAIGDGGDNGGCCPGLSGMARAEEASAQYGDLKRVGTVENEMLRDGEGDRCLACSPLAGEPEDALASRRRITRPLQDCLYDAQPSAGGAATTTQALFLVTWIIPIVGLARDLEFPEKEFQALHTK